MPSALLVGARDQQGRRGVVDPDERQHQPGRVVGGQFLVQHDLLGHRHAAAPFARPVRHREARAVQFGEPGLLEADELVVADAGLGRPPVARDVLFAPAAHLCAELELGRSRVQTRQPGSPDRRVSTSRVADSPNGNRRSGWL